MLFLSSDHNCLTMRKHVLNGNPPQYKNLNWAWIKHMNVNANIRYKKRHNPTILTPLVFCVMTAMFQFEFHLYGPKHERPQNLLKQAALSRSFWTTSINLWGKKEKAAREAGEEAHNTPQFYQNFHHPTEASYTIGAGSMTMDFHLCRHPSPFVVWAKSI